MAQEAVVPLCLEVVAEEEEVGAVVVEGAEAVRARRVQGWGLWTA
jgi:hypothetical protein